MKLKYLHLFSATIVLTFALALGSYLRLTGLSEHPMHADEAVQGLKTADLLETGDYTYNPYHFHGPTLYYLAVPLAHLRGQHDRTQLDEATLRLVPAIAGILTILGIGLFWKELGTSGLIATAVLLAVLPPAVYYSRYFVQESLFVCFQLWATGLLWRAWTTQSRGLAMAAGVAGGLVLATKETWPLTIIAALPCLALLTLLQPRHRWSTAVPTALRLLLPVLLPAFVVIVLFYSSFFQHPQGLLDMIRSFFVYEPVAGHEKPVQYYAHVLLGIGSRRSFLDGSGLLVVFSCLAAISLFIPRVRGLLGTPRWQLAATSLLFAFSYLALLHLFSYKNPWLLLMPIVVLAMGVGATAGGALHWRRPATSAALLALLLFSVWHFLHWTRLWAYRYPVDTRNPLAYVPTSSDILNLAQALQQEIKKAGPGIPVIVAGENYWPLPWYLRNHDATGYLTSWPDAIEDDAIYVLDLNLPGDYQELEQSHELLTYRGIRAGIIYGLYLPRN